ncbi:MAG: hypothetical protein AB2693_33640 [Candidatus Thiodiazotropha sp.]
MKYRRSKRNRNKSSPQDTSSPKKYRHSSVDKDKGKLEPEIVSETAALDMGDVEEMQSQSDLTNDSASLNLTGQNLQPNTGCVPSVNGSVSQPQIFDSTSLRFMSGQPILDQNVMQPGTPIQFHPQQMLNFPSPIQTPSQMQPHQVQASQYSQMPNMHNMPGSSCLSDGDILRIVNQLKLSLKAEIEKLVEAQVSLALAPIKQELVSLKEDIKSLIVKNDDLEQYSRRTCLRISGIKESRNEDVSQIVLNLANRIGAGIGPTEVDRAHRVGKLRGNDGADSANGEIRGRGREIIVKFTNYSARLKFLKGRAVLRNENANIFINEDLTKVRKTLAYECRRLKKARGIKNTWVYDGSVYIEDLRDQRIRVSCVDELAVFWASIQRAGDGNEARL